VARLFSTVTRLAEARVKHTARRLGLRAALVGGAVFCALVCIGFALAAATVALAGRVGVIEALAIMAAGALVLVLVLAGALAWEARRHRRLAVRRAALDRELFRAAAVSMVPGRAPSRPVLGLGLVAVGALLVLMRRRGD
jgi:uncharacterized iron-regulated membrane protein